VLEAFNHSGKHEIPLKPEMLAESLATQYQIPAEKISAALRLANIPQENLQMEPAAVSIMTSN
jgi:hypothetical protein